ncbi:MAG TPA: fumarylacetoacetate hydrolase family protein [Acidimicrobiales bacterium]|nr:fumarylacetoacetate hydrolase family protein [Acidimicrobiales bacterium]
MKLVLFDDYRLGILREDGVVDASSLLDGPADAAHVVDTLIASWSSLRPRLDELAVSGTARPLDEVQLRAPVPNPGKIMCMATNFREGTDKPPLPLNAFLASPEAVMDPGGTTVLTPHEFKICHHEAELVCVISKDGHDIAEADAMEYVFGYTAGVDISERASDSLNWGFLGKSGDGFKPIGPCIVTPDELGDPHALQVRLSVDGVLRQDYNTSDMGHYIAECIAWLSTLMTLRRGDLLFVGTNHQELGPIQDGETVEMSIERIGSFQFHVADPLKRSWPKGIDSSVGQSVRSRLEAPAPAAP